jgi:dinuclear metal center YbgI/SA1388 family protein
MKIKDIAKSLQQWAPLSYQESYDNSGLLVGDQNAEVRKILITLDVTEAVIREAIDTGCNLIIAHHPLIFKGLKKITPDHWVNRCVMEAIKNDIAIYAIHTNLDNVQTGVNRKIAEKLALQNTSILAPKSATLSKLVAFVPIEKTQSVLEALYHAGVGEIGNYDHCSFRVMGKGTFRPNESANPTIGTQLRDETVDEDRIEVILPHHAQHKVIAALKQSHPYEEVAYYLQSIDNKNQEVGSGMIGELKAPLSPLDFLHFVKEKMELKTMRYTHSGHDKIQKVAICGGSGSFLLSAAISQKADAFISGDFKYHDFFEGEEKILIADIGHYESEVFTKDLLYDFLQEKFANIAVRLTKVNTNPINYL